MLSGCIVALLARIQYRRRAWVLPIQLEGRDTTDSGPLEHTIGGKAEAHHGRRDGVHGGRPLRGEEGTTARMHLDKLLLRECGEDERFQDVHDKTVRVQN